MDNDNLYVVESDVGNTGMTPHKLYYGSIYEDYIADNGENDCLELDKLHAPSDFSINQVYPNPFNPVTTIHYTLPENMNINILVYDIRGRHLTTLFNDFQITGTYTINWDASLYPSGIYFIMMVSDNFKQTEKVILVK
jgi:Tol biopolymer transport system component